MGSWNDSIFWSINHWPQEWNSFLKFFSVALSLPVVKIGLGLMLVGMIARNAKTRKAVILALISIGIANTITNVFKEGLPMNRPFQDMRYQELQKDGTWSELKPAMVSQASDRTMNLRVGDSTSKGTASAHSANMAALAFAMCYFVRRWGTPWIAVALLTGISRIYTGAHYPYQVLLGWGCGLFSALVVIKTWEAFVRMRNGVQSEEHESPELA